jgi:hypothetical protein
MGQTDADRGRCGIWDESVTNSIGRRLDALRGGLAAEEPGARGIERLARNPTCFTLKALTIVGIKPATAASRILGEPETSSQSPFALILGNQFERRILESHGAMLFTLYNEQQVLGPTESKIVSVEELAPGPSLLARRRREAETRRILDQRLRRHPNAPNIVIKPRLIITIVGVPHAVEPDFLVAANGDDFYRVGEIKSYADREGKTSFADIRSACRQAAVGVVGLRQELQRQGVRDPSSLALPFGDLVLRGPGSLNPRLNRMKIEGEVDSLERALGETPRDLDELESMLPDGAVLSDPSVLSTLPHHYRSTCKEHCDLWKICRSRSLAAGDPVILGELAAEQLAAAGTLSRALDLLNSRGAPVRSAGEAILAEELRKADAELRRAVGDG